jgi:hypothetical protein
MATTTTDIGNRALLALGLQKTVSSLTQDSAEAKALNLIFAAVESWCFGLTNWNFARNTAVLTSLKGPTPTTPGSWTTAYPSPPWLMEYGLPSNFIRAIYLTNFDAKPGTDPGYLGEPKRFAVAFDTISTVQQKVILTNELTAVLVYTALVSDPTAWPWYFERLCVTALAHATCMALAKDMNLYQFLEGQLETQISIAVQANTIEGLIIQDTTPEWIQALGINYPYRRIEGPASPVLPGRQPTRRQQGDQ